MCHRVWENTREKLKMEGIGHLDEPEGEEQEKRRPEVHSVIFCAHILILTFLMVQMERI